LSNGKKQRKRSIGGSLFSSSLALARFEKQRATAMAAAASGGAPTNDDIDDRVYRAVKAGKNESEVRHVIESIDEPQREAAVNKAGRRENGEEETPLVAAFRLNRGDLLGLLLEAGAAFVPGSCANHTALTLCILFGFVGTLKVLLANRHRRGLDVEEEIRYSRSDPSKFMRPAHFCIMCVPHSSSSYARQLDCLEVLVKEGGADVNGRDECGRTSLHCLAGGGGITSGRAAAFTRLISLGADLEARDTQFNATPLFFAAKKGQTEMVQLLSSAGASVDAVSATGITPLLAACSRRAVRSSRDAIQLLLRLSSDTNRRAVNNNGSSAIDLLVWAQRTDDTPTAFKPFEPWQLEVVAELRRSGAPVKPRFAAALLPAAAAHANRLDAELAARRSESRRWRAHDCFVQLAFDYRDRREADEAVARSEARLVELEQRALERLDEAEEEIAALRAQLRERDAVIEQARRVLRGGGGATISSEEESEQKSESQSKSGGGDE
jgi:ankyrin repeat protein